MKKLLSLLGATALTFSGVGSVTACTKTSEAVQAALGNSKINLALASNSFARAMIVGNEKGYDANYIINNFAKGDIVNAPVDESEGVNKYSYLGDISSLYFNNNLYSKDFTTDLQLEGKKPEFASDNILGQLGSIMPILIKLIEEKGLFGALQIFLNMPLLWEFISPGMLKMLGDIIDEDTLLSFKDTFDDSIYEGLNYQEVLNSGVISLSNALDAFLNQKDDRTTIGYRSLSNEQLAENYQQSLEVIGVNIGKLLAGSAKLNFDLIENLPFVAELLRFVRVLFVYVEQFDQYRQYKPTNVKDKNHIFSASEDNFTVINKIRQQNYNTETNINFKKLIVNLQYYFTTSEDDPKGIHLMKLMQILFLPEEFTFKPEQNNGLMNIVYKVMGILTKAVPTKIEKKDFDIASILMLLLVGIITNGDISSIVRIMGSMLGSGHEKEKARINEIAKTMTKAFESLYNGQLIPDFLEIFGILGTAFGFKIPEINLPFANLQELLTTPLKNILGQNAITSLFGDNSVDTLLNKIALTAGIDNKYAVIDNKNDFPTKYLANIFAGLAKWTVWTDAEGKQHSGILLQKAVSDPTKFLEVLGYKKDDKGNDMFDEDSPAWYLNAIIGKNDFILNILAELLKDAQESINKQNEVAQKLFNDIKNSWLSALKTEITVIKQDFTYNGNEIVQLTETIKYNNIEYNVVVKKVNGYFVFNTISKL
ncbi:hypothetical protein SSYRP_v1c09770 [Spiroplasma syrphidicola EA-1]|uniref:MOLPALP family lipoprotein n=1 Tax=Spiroplasma syrphidicola EA-1 TaxID=1276229 RepID=R4UF78_9MOLU|nr:MOLPALP family lipoprotein [Spiroplasma syrphidicola]AGM26564.1 hypothetical protein SSYRP_v1c09770 [Spiroplasma syrphidicola EA-1]